MGIEHLPVKLGSPSVPMPGYDVQILDEGGHPMPAGELGAIAIKLPLPPGTLPNLWNAEDRYQSSYLNSFPGYYETGDAGIMDADGYLYIMARTDDVINVAGHRLSTGAMEEVLSCHPDVAECAVIGVADALKGQVPSRVRLPDQRREPAQQRNNCGMRKTDARKNWPGSGFQTRRGGGPSAENPIRQNPARYHGADCRRKRIQNARND